MGTRPVKLPVVLTKPEGQAVIGQLSGSYRLMANLLYDFGYGQIAVRDGKGGKDQVTMLPEIIASGKLRSPRWKTRASELAPRAAPGVFSAWGGKSSRILAAQSIFAALPCPRASRFD